MFKIGDKAYVGCNSYISPGKKKYNHHKFYNLYGEEVIIIEEPRKEIVDCGPIIGLHTANLVLVKSVKTGKFWTVSYDWLCDSFEKTQSRKQAYHSLAEELMELSDEMMAYDY